MTFRDGRAAGGVSGAPRNALAIRFRLSPGIDVISCIKFCNQFFLEKIRFFTEGDDKTEKGGYIMEHQLWKK